VTRPKIKDLASSSNDHRLCELHEMVLDSPCAVLLFSIQSSTLLTKENDKHYSILSIGSCTVFHGTLCPL
jgi:hypothetical protein